jgi:hypothetical protein
VRLKHYHATTSFRALLQAPAQIPAGSSVVHTASGVSGLVVDRGSLDRFIPYMVQSVRHGYQVSAPPVAGVLLALAALARKAAACVHAGTTFVITAAVSV